MLKKKSNIGKLNKKFFRSLFLCKPAWLILQHVVLCSIMNTRWFPCLKFDGLQEKTNSPQAPTGSYLGT